MNKFLFILNTGIMCNRLNIMIMMLTATKIMSSTKGE